MKPTTQHAFLVIDTIKEGQTASLEAQLGQIYEEDVEENRWIPFRQLETIHFARIFIIPASADVKGTPVPAQLAMSTNYDGSLDEHLAEMDRLVGESGLDKVFGHCVGYPAEPDSTNRISYLKRHSVKHAAFYVGTVGRSVGQIRQENELRDQIQGFLDSKHSWAGSSPADVRKAIQDFVDSNPELAWAKTPPPPRLTPGIQFVKTKLTWIVGAVVLATAALVIFGVIPLSGLLWFLALIAVVLILWAVTLRIKEERDPEMPLGTSCPDEELAAAEDQVVQNQMSVVNNMKPGFFRLFTEWIVQTVVNFAARVFANEGNLAGIPSIHFARWVFIDRGRRLLFLSNFDGSWENYLGDFIDKSASGLTAVWSNTVFDTVANGFPKTKWLFREGGARDEQRFKEYARTAQITTNVWYSAYKGLSVQNIDNNSKIREHLYGDLTKEETIAWLRRL